MNFYVLTLFPQMVEDALSYSIMGRARKAGVINVKSVNIRDFSGNKHNTVDDYPYGGGAGMVMAAPPIYRCYESVINECRAGKCLYMSPRGKKFSQQMALEFKDEENIIIICGHYEGIDERAIELTNAEEVSVGDYILSGGEIAALAVIDAVSRLVDGVLGKAESHMEESFSNGLLEYPHYTRPPEFMGKTVPEILLSGNHKAIRDWRFQQSVSITEKMNNGRANEMCESGG